MNIAILSRSEHLYSTKSLLKAGRSRGHDMEVIDPLACNLTLENGKAVLRYYDEVVNDLDAIIPRIGSSQTATGVSVVRQFEALNVFSSVSSQAILNSRDKWTCFQLLVRQQIPTPKTVIGNFYGDAEGLLNQFPDGPIIIKLLEGTHGNGVILAEGRKHAITTIETLESLNARFVLQEFIEESKGADLRVIVVDGMVVAAMKRQCSKGDFRSNLHRGGTAKSISLSKTEEQVAIKTAKTLGLGVCGVDILQSKNGPMVLEVNSTPGLEGIEKTTQKSVSKSIISYIERHYKI